MSESSHVGKTHVPLSQCHVTLNPLNCWRGPQKAISEAFEGLLKPFSPLFHKLSVKPIMSDLPFLGAPFDLHEIFQCPVGLREAVLGAALEAL